MAPASNAAPWLLPALALLAGLALGAAATGLGRRRRGPPPPPVPPTRDTHSLPPLPPPDAGSAAILPAPAAAQPSRRRWLGHRRYWFGQALFWGGLAAFLCTCNFVDPEPDSDHLQEFAGTTVVALVGVALTHLLRLGLLKWRAHIRSWRRFIATVVAFDLLIAAAMVGVLFVIEIVFLPSAPSAKHPPETLGSYLSTLLLIFAILLTWATTYLGYCYYRSYHEAAFERLRLLAAFREAELRTLKSQVNPHFLFNSLNTLRSLIPFEHTQPRAAITELAELLRATLTLGDRATVSFAEELETVANYLALERRRFENRLNVRSRIEPAASAWQVPPLLLQTLLENAVKYGVAPHPSGGEITYEAFVRDQLLHLRVSNPGTLRAASDSTGLGLANARARLLHLYGPAATLSLTQAHPDQVTALVRIPAARSPASVATA